MLSTTFKPETQLMINVFFIKKLAFKVELPEHPAPHKL